MADSFDQGIEKATHILRDAGAKEIYVFGSVAEGRATSHSDIDLAVRGLPPEVFFEAVGRVAMALTREFDIIDMDDPSPFTEYLERKGKLRRVA